MYYRLKIQEKCVCGGGGDESLPKENNIDQYYCCPLIRIVFLHHWLYYDGHNYVMNSF